MDFVTPEYYLYFLPLVFLLTFGVASRQRRRQILILLVMSYVFFWLASGWHLILLLISTCIDWTAGRKMHETDDAVQRKRWLRISLVTNLSLLGVFKYLDFIIESWNLVSLRFTDSLDVIVGGNLSGNRWRTQAGYGERDFRLRSYRLSLGLQWNFDEKHALFASTGTEFGREVEIKNAAGTVLLDKDLSSAPNFEIGYRFRY